MSQRLPNSPEPAKVAHLQSPQSWAARRLTCSYRLCARVEFIAGAKGRNVGSNTYRSAGALHLRVTCRRNIRSPIA
jgi:hypothetical protein